ncbi:MAG TPA: hypothetical protein VI365_31650, partial [Trebonia sp.]
CVCLGPAAGVAAAGGSIGNDGASGPADGYLTAVAFAAVAALVCRHAQRGRPGSAVPVVAPAVRAPGGKSGELPPYIVGR